MRNKFGAVSSDLLDYACHHFQITFEFSSQTSATLTNYNNKKLRSDLGFFIYNNKNNSYTEVSLFLHLHVYNTNRKPAVISRKTNHTTAKYSNLAIYLFSLYNQKVELHIQQHLFLLQLFTKHYTVHD